MQLSLPEWVCLPLLSAFAVSPLRKRPMTLLRTGSWLLSGIATGAAFRQHPSSCKFTFRSRKALSRHPMEACITCSCEEAPNRKMLSTD